MKIYIIRCTTSGKYYQGGGYWGATSVDAAMTYRNLSSARQIVTRQSKQCPNNGIPEILEYTAKETAVIDETERVLRVISRNKRLLEKHEDILRQKGKLP